MTLQNAVIISFLHDYICKYTVKGNTLYFNWFKICATDNARLMDPLAFGGCVCDCIFVCVNALTSRQILVLICVTSKVV